MPWGSEKGFYAVRCMVQSLAFMGSRDLQCEASRQSLPIARVSEWGWLCVDLHVGETHVRVSVMMLPALRGSDGKSHVSCYMHESVCFSRFRFRPSDAQSQDGLPQYEQPDGAMLGTPACRLWHFESRCMFWGCGWPWLERPVFSDSKPSSEWVGAAMCFRSCAPKVVTSGVEN